jgi:hypothetical protein
MMTRWMEPVEANVSERRQGRSVATIRRGVSVAAILMLLVGCRSRHRSDDLMGNSSSANQPKTTALGPNHLAAEGMATITAACEKQSFENARSSLIASQTGLHEDVFALRSRTSSASFAFSLDDALRLEDLLRKDLQGNQRTVDPQGCVRQFEGYLETLTDPIVDQDKLAKDLDASAFKDSTKEAQEELRREKETEALAPKK